MSPRFSPNNATHSRPTKAKSFSYGSLRKLPLSPYLSYLNYIFFCQSTSIQRVSALLNHIFHVLFLGAGEKMFRIDARRVVASMANLQVASNRPKSHFKRQAMGQDLFSTSVGSASDSKNTIALLVSLPTPFPTIRAFLNLSPKTLFKIHWASIA